MLKSLIADVQSAFSFVEGWVLQASLAVLATGLLDLLQRLVLRRLARKVRHTRNLWDDAVLDALVAPLGLTIWVIGISAAAGIAAAQSESPLFNYVDEARKLGVIIAVIWFALRLTRGVERNLLERAAQQEQALDRTTVDAVGKLARIVIIVTGVLVAMQNLGFSISGVLAAGGIGGLAVGLAARDMLANFFGGFTVYADRPFSVGDWVRSPDREIEGTVEKIGWRQTRIRTFDKRPLYVPNSIFTNVVVENPSRMTNRRIFETIGVRYDDFGALEGIVDDVRDMLQNHDEIDTGQTLMVFFNAYGASSLDFFVYCFTKTVVWKEYHRIKQDVLFRIGRIIEKHDAEIAFPTRTLHLAESIHFPGEETEEPEPVRQERERRAGRSARRSTPSGQAQE